MTVVATRYARALIESLGGDANPGPDAGLVQLGQIRDLLEREPDARKLLTNPVMPTPRRVRIVEEIGLAMGLDGRVIRLFTLIVERRRLEALADIVEAYRKMLDERNGILRAVVTAAAPLSEGELQDIRARLERSQGQRVEMEVHQDSTLIGGLVVRIGSTVYDGSVRQQLAGFKNRLMAG